MRPLTAARPITSKASITCILTVEFKWGIPQHDGYECNNVNKINIFKWAMPVAALTCVALWSLAPVFGQQNESGKADPPPTAPAAPNEPPKITPTGGDNVLPPDSVASLALPTRPTTVSNPILREATTALRDGDAKRAAHLLKPVDVKTLLPNDARRWRTLSALSALRTGDRKWLDSITSDPEYFSNSINLITITVQRFLQDGRYNEARALLGQIKNAEQLDEIPRRRYLQLGARLEQLTGHPDRERVYVAKLVDFAGRWASPACQACHANPKKFGDETTTLNVSDWWVGERFSTLVKQKGDAGAVRVRAQAALNQSPNNNALNNALRLRIAYALRAEGKNAEAETALRSVPWAECADRPQKTPLRLATFP